MGDFADIDFGCGLIIGIVAAMSIMFLFQICSPGPIDYPDQITILSYSELRSTFATHYYVYTEDDQIYEVYLQDYLRLSSIPDDEYPISYCVAIEGGHPPVARLLNFSASSIGGVD